MVIRTFMQFELFFSAIIPIPLSEEVLSRRFTRLASSCSSPATKVCDHSSSNVERACVIFNDAFEEDIEECWRKRAILWVSDCGVELFPIVLLRIITLSVYVYNCCMTMWL